MSLSSQQLTTTSLPPQHSNSKSEMLETYVKRYTTHWPTRSVHRASQTWPGSRVQTNGHPEVFFLTGTTGTLGSQLLADLLARPDEEVGRIYAFNRKHPTRSFRERHEAIFAEKGNDVHLLDSPKVVFVEGDTSVEGFRITQELYAEMRDTITTIIHNAWPVKFTKPLAEFAPNLQSLRNLIDLALKSPHQRPPRLIFISSIGMIKAWGETPPIPEAPMIDPNSVSSNGYPQSKWVAERILTVAKQETDLEPLIIRVGQLAGSINGCWSENEWFPALVSASRVVGCVPDCGDSVIGFVPLHIGARAVINLRTSPLNFAHVVHPRPISSIKLMQLVCESLGSGVHIVPTDEWLAKLHSWKCTSGGGTGASPSAPNTLQVGKPQQQQQKHQHPALKLLDFYEEHLNPKMYRGKLKRRYQITGMAIFETTKTSENVPSVFSETMLPPLGRREVEKWVGFWRRCCWGPPHVPVDEKLKADGNFRAVARL